MRDIKQRLVVTGAKRENKRLFYTVKYNDTTYDVPSMEYQRKSGGFPTELDCIVKQDGDNVRITQDYSNVIAYLYKVGQTYSFRVKDRQNDFYKVIDTNGLIFWLTEYGKRELKEGQFVKARVLSVKRVRVCLALVDEKPASKAVFKTIEQVAQALKFDAGMLSRLVESHPRFIDAADLYKAQDGEWLLVTVDLLDDILMKGDDKALAGCPTAEMFQKLSMYILEGSDTLKNMEPVDRKAWIDRLTVVAQHSEDYLKACQLVSQKQGMDYILEQLRNLKDSEYLYQPTRKLRILMCIINLDDSRIADIMDEIFGIILDGDKAHWLTEPFRSAFVDLLELFITEYREKATRMAGDQFICKMIRAIAIQQLLSNKDDDIDRRLNRATYYKLLAYMQRYSSSNVLEGAFNSLFVPFSDDMEYSWDDIKNIDTLYYHAAFPQHEQATYLQKQVYQGKDTMLVVDNSGVVIRPTTGSPSPMMVNRLIKWRNIEVMSNHPVSYKLKDANSLAAVQRYWKEVENNLWDKSPGIVNRAYMGPSEGEKVLVKVVGQDEQCTSLLCQIVQDYTGKEGWLSLDDIVPYIQPGHDNLAYFNDTDGKPFYFEVYVVADEDEDGLYEFSMMGVVEEYLRSLHQCGDLVDCTILTDARIMPYGLCCMGITSEGCACLVKQTPDDALGKGCKVRATVQSVSTLAQYVCEYHSDIDQGISIPVAFRRLIRDISVDYDAEQMDEQIAVEAMTDDVVKEIIGILDRESVIADSRCLSYSFLSLAGILAHMIDDQHTMEYYDKRKTLITAFDEYEKNGSVNDSKITQLKNTMGQQLIDSDYLVNDYMTKFQILNALRRKDDVEPLFNIHLNTANNSLRNAADLAIAILLTDRFDIANIQRVLIDRINKEIGVTLKESKGRKFGMETATQEFKTSVVFPAGYHMKPSKELQGMVIVRTICGFLNSDTGGKLYIGVNDGGYSQGLAEDMKYLKCNRDGYSRYIHQLVRKELGEIANQCCNNCDWIDDEGYEVYQMNIRPCPELVRFRGVCVTRQDTETRDLPENEVATFAKMHDEAYQRYLADHQQEPEAAPVVADEPVREAPRATASSSDQILTSLWRPNILMDYEEGYGEDVAAYVHFLPDWKYAVTDRGMYRKAELSLAIANDEADGYIVVAYKSGRILVADTSGVLAKTQGNLNSRCKTEVPLFISPAHKDDAIMTVWENMRGELCARIDDHDALVERHCNGGLSNDGAEIIESKYERIVACEVVPAAMASQQAFVRYRNHKDGLGYKLRAEDKATISQKLGLQL